MVCRVLTTCRPFKRFYSLMNNHFDKTEAVLLEILKTEIGMQGCKKKHEVSLETLRQVMRLAKEHTVQGVVANAAVTGRLTIADGPENGKGNGKGMAVMKLMQLTMIHKRNLNLFERTVGRFAHLMKEYNIAYVVFKGLAMARLYPTPWMRTMGDVDFYVPKSCFDRAVEVIERELNVLIEKDDVDKHFAFDYEGIRFEMHYQIETFGNKRHQLFFNGLIDECVAKGAAAFAVNDADNQCININVLQPEEDLVVVFKHWFNHLLVEGVGLRQTLDLAVLLQAYDGKIDAAKLMKDVDMMGYKNAFKAMLAMMRKHFGVATADSLCTLNARDERYGDKLLEAVMESGNFGRKAYKTQSSGRKKSMETAQRALAHCIKFFWLAPIDILCLIPKRIGISVKQKINVV